MGHRKQQGMEWFNPGERAIVQSSGKHHQVFRCQPRRSARCYCCPLIAGLTGSKGYLASADAAA